MILVKKKLRRITPDFGTAARPVSIPRDKIMHHSASLASLTDTLYLRFSSPLSNCTMGTNVFLHFINPDLNSKTTRPYYF